MSKKVIVVFGATGLQGGSVVKAILGDSKLQNEYTIRAITRDTSKPAAQHLASQGVELASADLNSKSSTLQALQQAHSVFLVTDFWSTMSRDIEVRQGKTVADAAKEAGIQHMVFSSLENVSKISNGKLKHVTHFDGKNEIEQYIRNQGFPTTSFIYPGFYMNNLLTSINKQEDGSYVFAAPVTEKAQYPFFATSEDYGKFMLPVLKLPTSEVNGKRFLAATAYYTPADVVSTFEKATGKKARFVQLSPEAFKKFCPPAAAEELLENMQLLDGPGYYNGESLEPTLKLLESEPTSLEAYIKAQEQWAK